MKRWMIGIIILLGAFIITAGLGTVIYIKDLNTEPIYFENLDYDVDKADERELSAIQDDYLNRYDYPSRFTILFYESDGQEIYNEQWYYDEVGMVLNFINGDLISESPLEVNDEMEDANYKPEDYSYGMTLAETLEVSDIDEFLYVPVEEDFMEDAKAIYAENLMIGLKDDEVIYIETIGLD